MIGWVGWFDYWFMFIVFVCEFVGLVVCNSIKIKFAFVYY